MLEIIKDTDTLYSLKSELQNVFLKHKKISFSSPDFIFFAWQNFFASNKDAELFFVVAKRNGSVVSYIPLCIDKKGTLRFIFDLHTDFCGVVGDDLDFSFYKDLHRSIMNEAAIKRINLDNLLPNDPLLNAFKHFFGAGVQICCYNNYSFLESTTDSVFFKHLKSKEKSELKRIQNKNVEYNFLVITSEHQFPKEEILKLRQVMISNKVRSSDFFDDSFVRFAQNLFAKDELEIFSKWNNEKQMVSCSLVLKNQELRMVWIDLYAEVKNINLSAYIDYLHFLEKQKPITFNFGRGSYDYKAKNFLPNLQNLYNLRFSKSKYSFLFTNHYPLRYFFKRIIKS